MCFINWDISIKDIEIFYLLSNLIVLKMSLLFLIGKM